jgi:signal transduction histidine kinase
MVSDDQDPETEVEAAKAGALSLIRKPLSVQHLNIALSRAEDHLKLKQELEDIKNRAIESERLATVGTMSATFAHEIANPMGIISGHLHMVQNIFANQKGLDPRFIRSLEAIENSVIRITKLIRSLSNLSRSHHHKKKDMETLGAIIKDAAGLCEHRISEFNIDFQIYDTHSETLIFCDRVELSQVLVNLITNACHAVESNDIKRIEIATDIIHDRIEIYVKDNGSGIPDEIAKKIFEPFFTTKPVGRGTGLGLSTCRKIIKSYQGDLSFETSPKGTMFRIDLPCVEAHPQAG